MIMGNSVVYNTAMVPIGVGVLYNDKDTLLDK